MKIENGYSKHLETIRQTTQQSGRQTRSAEETSEREPGVSVNISEEAKALLEAEESEHAARVEEIKAQLEEGSYEVNPDAISNGLLSTIQAQKEQ